MDAIQKRAYCATLILVVLLWKSASAAQFVPLSDLVPGMQLSEVREVSDDGSTVVGAYSPDGVTGRAFRWRFGEGLVELLRPNLEPINGLAVKVSADGRKVLGFDADFGPFLWTEGTGTEYLNIFPGIVHEVIDMSGDGSVIVGNVKRESPQGSYYEAFRWSAADGVTILDSIPESNGEHPYVSAISDDGTTIVGSQDFDNPDGIPDTHYAFRWTEHSGTISLNAPSGATGTYAYETTSDGSIVLGGVDSGSFNSFRWRESTGFELLGPHPNALAYSVSDFTPDGDLIVGSASLTDLTDHEPFIWDEARGFRNLRNLLESATGVPLMGWDDDLGIANAVSANGTVIVGYGRPDGAQREQGWVMLFEPGEIIPEPTSLLLATFAVVTVGLRRAARPKGSR